MSNEFVRAGTFFDFESFCAPITTDEPGEIVPGSRQWVPYGEHDRAPGNPAKVAIYVARLKADRRYLAKRSLLDEQQVTWPLVKLATAEMATSARDSLVFLQKFPRHLQFRFMLNDEHTPDPAPSLWIGGGILAPRWNRQPCRHQKAPDERPGCGHDYSHDGTHPPCARFFDVGLLQSANCPYHDRIGRFGLIGETDDALGPDRRLAGVHRLWTRLRP